MPNITQQLSSSILTLTLSRPPANALNLQMIDALRNAIADAQKNDAIKGVIITGTAHFFSGGVDLTEVYDYDSPKTALFWGSFLKMAAELSAFTKPLIAAITGHSPAGGCIIACCADYRVMAKGEKYKIGLNEMMVGIAPRLSILELYSFWIGKRKAYQYLLEGKLLSTQEAFNDGLVDEVAELEDVYTQALKKMQTYIALPQHAFIQTKQALKSEVVQALTEHHERDLDLLHKQLMGDESRKIMGQVVAYLKSKK
jgi:Delta3-Delta2-enoyl-CoA isomerase